MLSAGTCIEWLRDDLGIIATSKESETVAAQCTTSGDVWFVPALLGLGTPVWDFGARGTLVGLTRGSGRPEIVRAVLEGVAHRGADLVEASESDSGFPIAALRTDGGMSDNEVFVQALADAIGRPVEISPVQEATTLGAGLLAGLAVGTYATTSELAETFSPRRTVEPQRGEADRVAARANAGWRPGTRPKAPSRSSRASPSEGGLHPPQKEISPPERPPSPRITLLLIHRLIPTGERTAKFALARQQGTPGSRSSLGPSGPNWRPFRVRRRPCVRRVAAPKGRTGS